jgi:hypothetical protein
METVTMIDGFVLYDPDTGTEHDVVLGYDDQDEEGRNPEIHLFVRDASEWVELTRSLTAKINGAPVAYTVYLDTWKENGYDRGTMGTSNEFQSWIAVNTSKDPVEVDVISGSAANQISLASMSAQSRGWADDENVTVYKGVGLMDFVGDSSTTPQIRWLGMETQKKISMFYMHSDGTKRYPLQAMKRDQREYFSGSYTITLQSGWYPETGGGLSTLFAKFGSAENPATGTGNTGSQYPDTAWLKMSHTIADRNPDSLWTAWCFMKIVPIYNGYQRGDPIYSLVAGSSAGNIDVQVTVDFEVNLGLMPKEITALEMWTYGSRSLVASEEYQQTLAALKTIDDASYTLAQTVDLMSFFGADPGTWGRDSTSYRPMTLTYIYRTDDDPESTANLHDTLGHASDENRSLIQPRFVAVAAREIGNVVAVDADNDTVRLSAYSGNGVHEDDNFPDLTTDNLGGKQKVALRSKGELMGLAIMDDDLWALRGTEIEVVDLHSGPHRILHETVVAKRGIITTPHGLIWAGEDAIRWWPINGGGTQTLNPQWVNFYDGTLKAANGTPFLSRTQRQGIIMGYDYLYRELWVQFECADEAGTGTEVLNVRYSFRNGEWNVRKLDLRNDDPVRWFANRTDSLVIGNGYGIYKYPNRTGSFPHEDSVESNDTSSGGVIETLATLHLGSLYGLRTNAVPVNLLVDHEGGGSGAFTLNLYANKEATAFDTQTIPATDRPTSRMLDGYGRLEDLKFKFSLESPADVTNFDVNTVVLGYLVKPRIGNS